MGQRRRQPNVQPPQQERSRLTLESLLAVGEGLLAEKPFGEVTVADIVDRAGSSAGSFYARFAGKDAYLRELLQRLVDQLGELTESAMAALDEPVSLDTMAGLLVDSTVALHRGNRGVIRAARLQAIDDPSLTMTFVGLLSDTANACVAKIDPEDSVGDGSDMAQQLELGLLTIVAVLDQELFHGDHARTAASGSDPDAVARLKRLFLAAIDVPSESS